MGTVRIERRFRGPPTTGNGGYVAGLVASALGGSNCTVTLKAPPPLDHDLTLETDGTSASLLQDDQIVVTAAKEPVEIDVPPPPTLAEAQDAEPRFSGHSHHIFPGCFVCGPDREAGDGMRIFPGALHDHANRNGGHRSAAHVTASRWLIGRPVTRFCGFSRSTLSLSIARIR